MELKDLAPLLVKKERTGGDIEPTLLSPLLQGGHARNQRRKELEQLVAAHPILSDRNIIFRNHKERYEYGIQKAYYYIQLLHEHQITDPIERAQVYVALGEPLAIDVHRSMFIPTLENQADEQQQAKWLPLAYGYKILGAYAQTELGHGSNVQGLETTATYDAKTQEFIINSPTLTSRKWWPGGLGKTATHAVVHARTFVENGTRDVGIQAFIVQLRSLENHQPLAGIQVGDIGPKVGFNAVDNGYCAFDHIRIPRDQMLMRYAKVLPDGTFVPPKSDKLVYLTMVYVRAHLLVTSSWVLGKATTIATRFSAARVQGRRIKVPNDQEILNRYEFQVLDYQNQQNTLFTNLATSYALNFAGWILTKLHDSALETVTNGDASFEWKLAELHGISSGLKGWAAEYTSNGVEQLRRACGGHGFTASSNLAHLHAETVGACTFEGTWDVLVQQHARYLLKMLSAISTSRNHNVTSSLTAFLGQIQYFTNSNLHATIQSPKDSIDFEFLRQAYQVRSARLLCLLAQEMEACGHDMNACMVLITRVSIAHVELMLLTSFMDGIATLPNGPTRVAVTSLCAFFGLSFMVKNIGEFREDDYLSSSQARFVRHQLVILFPIIRKNAILFTDAWDFSDFILNSAIGGYDGDIYRELVKRVAMEPLNQTQVPTCYQAFMKPLLHSSAL